MSRCYTAKAEPWLALFWILRCFPLKIPASWDFSDNVSVTPHRWDDRGIGQVFLTESGMPDRHSHPGPVGRHGPRSGGEWWSAVPVHWRS